MKSQLIVSFLLHIKCLKLTGQTRCEFPWIDALKCIGSTRKFRCLSCSTWGSYSCSQSIAINVERNDKSQMILIRLLGLGILSYYAIVFDVVDVVLTLFSGMRSKLVITVSRTVLSTKSFIFLLLVYLFFF